MQSSDNVAATQNTDILIDIATMLPDKIFDVDAEHTNTNIYVNITNLIQQQFKEIACSHSLIEFMYMIGDKEPQDAFKKSHVIKHSPFCIVSLYYLHHITRSHLLHQLSKNTLPSKIHACFFNDIKISLPTRFYVCHLSPNQDEGLVKLHNTTVAKECKKP